MIEKIKKNDGFMIVEILVAITIITVAVLAAMEVTQKAIFVSRQSLHASEAGFLLEEGAEATRIARDNAWVGISALTVGTDYYPTFSGGTWTLSPNTSQVGIFTRTVRVTNVNRDATTADIVSNGGVLDTGTKLITVTVSWLEEGQTLSKTLSLYLMNIFQ
jgi:Tfp pilus assembly protein PilV